MDARTVIAASAAQRRALADDLAGLDAPAWSTPSLCAGWDVRTVLAHLVVALSPSPVPFLTAVVRSGGRSHRANDRLARTAAEQPVSELLALLRERADSPVAPPVVGPRGPLTDVLVHGGDVRLPLGLPHDPAADAVRTALEFATSGRAIGFVPRRRLTGLRLVAEDLGTAYGDGEPVTGRGIDLLMAGCGRAAVLGRLVGDGVDVLRRRLG